jgi:hypothetical protein
VAEFQSQVRRLSEKKIILKSANIGVSRFRELSCAQRVFAGDVCRDYTTRVCRTYNHEQRLQILSLGRGASGRNRSISFLLSAWNRGRVTTTTLNTHFIDVTVIVNTISAGNGPLKVAAWDLIEHRLPDICTNA